MVRWLGILFRTFRSAVRTRRELALENLALRQQLAVWKARLPRPRLTERDRIFWIVLSRLWKNWRSSLQVVRPETVVQWHRRGFRLLTVRRQVEISGKGGGLERGVDLTALKIEEGDDILPRDIDRGLLPVRQHHQTVPRPLTQPGDRFGDGDLLRIDRDGL